MLIKNNKLQFFFVFLFISAFLSGCSTTSKPLQFSVQNSSQNEVWPQKPETSRYRYLGELHGENFDEKVHERSLFETIVGLIVGKPKPVKLKRPYSVHVSQDNIVYVADVGLRSVMAFNLTDHTVRLWKDATESFPFQAPVSVATVGKEVWVSDVDAGAIFRLSKEGKPLGSFGQDILKRPIGISYDTTQKLLYVADSSAHNIKVFNSAAVLVKTIGGHGDKPGLFNFPSVVDFKDGKLYVSDTMNARIQVMDPEADYKVTQSIGHRGMKIGNTPRPKGISADSDGNIYIIESYYGYLLVFNEKGEFLLPISGQGRTLGRLDLPVGVTVDHLDRVYLADTFNGRVVMLQYLGDD